MRTRIFPQISGLFLATLIVGILIFNSFANAKNLWVLPKKSGPVPGLLVLPDKGGIDSFVQREAELWSEQGFGVFVVDLYDGGEAPKNEVEANRLWDRLDLQDSAKKVEKAWGEIQNSAAIDKTRLGILSYGASSALTLKAAKDHPEIRTVILVEGTPILDRGILEGIRGRLYGIYGMQNSKINSKNFERFESLLRQLKIDFQLKKYPHATSGFLDYTRSSRFNAAEAQKAKTDLQKFLKKFLSLEDPIKY